MNRHAYTEKLREVGAAYNQRIRGRNGLGEQSHIHPTRLEAIWAGARPTPAEHKAIARAIPRMSHFASLLDQWDTEFASEIRAPQPVPEVQTAQNPSEVTPPPPVPAAAAPRKEPLMLRPRTFGEFARAARERADLEPEELAELLGVSRSAVVQWELDGAAPVVENYAGLTKLFPDLLDEHVPRPASRDIPKPVGRSYNLGGVPTPAATAVKDDPTPVSGVVVARGALDNPAIVFGMTLARSQPALAKGTRAQIIALLRDGARAGLSVDEIAVALETEV